MKNNKFKLEMLFLIITIISILLVTDITALQIGGRATSFFNGTIDEVAIYNRVLTLVEILEHFLFNRTATTQDIKASVNQSWDMDSDDISTAYRWYKNKVLNASTVQNETNLVLYMPFDHNTLDYALDNNGTNNGSVLTSGGKIEGAHKFDGVDDSVNVANNNALNFSTGNFSISLWAYSNGYTNQGSAWNCLAGKGILTGNPSSYFAICIDSDDIIYFLVNDDDNKAVGVNIKDGWHHIAGVKENNDIKIYVDGVKGTDSTTSGDVSNSADLRIGHEGHGNRHFNGIIDELAIYNRSLSAAEIYQQYTAGRWSGYRIDDNYTKTGENWTIETRTVDFNHWGQAYNSSEIIIQGAQISLNAVINTSPKATNKTNETLWCYNISQSVDQNINLIITFAWYNNSVLTDFTSQYIGYKNTTKHQNWTCEIKAVAESDILIVNSTNLTILNSEPYFNATIPDIAKNTGDIWSYPAVNVTDVDGDTLTYYINDSRITLDPPNINDTAIVEDIGTHYINISVSDGEANISQVFTYSVGDLVPTWSGNQTNASNALKKNGSVQLNLTLEDTFSLSWYVFAWNDTGELRNITNESISGKSFKIIKNLTATRKGMHAWQVVFNDTAAQFVQTPVFLFDVYNTMPSVPNVSNPGNNSYIQQVDINFSSIDIDDEDTINYTIFINDTYNISSTNNITNLAINDGVYTLKVSAYDQLNYTSNSTEILFTKDSTKPVITLISPGKEELIESGGVTFIYNVSDATRLQNCSLFIDNDLAASTNETIRYTTQTFTNGFVDGVYTWSINCTDMANNTGNSSIRSFTIKIPEAVMEGTVGGAGGAITPKVELVEYEVSEESIEVDLRLGQAKTEQITIENTGATRIDVILYPKQLSEFVFIDEAKFSLDINEKKTVTLNIVGKEIGAHPGTLIISASGVRTLVPMVVSVGSEKTLFDVKIDIPADYKEILSGENLKAQITLFNIVGGLVDVTVNYIVKDLEGNVLFDESEIFAVEEQKSYVKVYELPELEPGSYVALIEVRYGDSFAVSSEMFSVKEEGIPLAPARTTRYMLIYTLLAVIALFMIYVFVRFLLKKKKR